MDSETERILIEQKTIKDLTGHQAWPIVRKKFTDKILELQNAFDIDAKDPQTMFVDLQARKIASTLLFDFLREVEGTADQADENNKLSEKSYVVREE